MTMTHIRLRTVVVGDVLSDGSEVTMIGPSAKRPGSAFLAVKRDGRHQGMTLPFDEIVAVRAA